MYLQVKPLLLNRFETGSPEPSLTSILVILDAAAALRGFHAGTPGNERADVLSGQAADKMAWLTTSLARLKLQISQKFRTAKEDWHKDPRHHRTEEIPPRPFSLALTIKEITWPHGSPDRRSAVYLKRIRKTRDDKWWYCPIAQMQQPEWRRGRAGIRAAYRSFWPTAERNGS
jgi:hypothetical protein